MTHCLTAPGYFLAFAHFLNHFVFKAILDTFFCICTLVLNFFSFIAKKKKKNASHETLGVIPLYYIYIRLKFGNQQNFKKCIFTLRSEWCF